MSYNLSDNVNDTFPLELRGLKYVMRYPTTGELEEIEAIGAEYQKLRDEGEPEKAKEANTRLEDFLYSLITPVEHQGNFKDAIKKENVLVFRNFNTMIKKELSVG